MKGRHRNYLIFADEDLKSAKVLLKERLYNQVCFHCQQCAEKSLKSFIKLREGIVPRIHGISELLGNCAKHNKEFRVLSEECKFMERFYIPTRYPEAMVGTLPEGLPTQKDAEKAVEYAEIILNFIKKILDNQ